MAEQSTKNDSSTFETLFIRGADPKEGKWPGLRPDLKENADGMDITWDVAIALRDGTKIYADIFKPENASDDQKLPIILTWSPYGKHGPKTFAMFPNSGVPEGSVSQYAVWEGPDPLHWTQRGYAVINADCRGSWGSEGNCEILSPQQGQDGYDVVEWAAAQPWSNGKVGLCGVSYLAIIQWQVAATNPPHLACIMPWEGYTDVYRDYSHHGGIPETHFVKFMEWSCRCSLGKVEDWVAMQRLHPLFDAYQQTRKADLSQIKVPAYIVADWGDQGLHTRGTLIGFEEISSEEKWLDIHGRKKWQYFYQDESLERQDAFFRKFLKQDSSSPIDGYPRVRIEIRDRAYEGTVGEDTWPIARAKPTFKYVDCSAGQLADWLPKSYATTGYNSQSDETSTFTYVFQEETEMTGTMRLHLWVSSESAQDMDIFVRLDKRTADDQVVPFVAVSMIDDGPLALGWIRASHRELDAEKSTELQPILRHQRELSLCPGEVVPVDVEIWASSTRFAKGERLSVMVGGRDLFNYDLVQCQRHEDLRNVGRHTIHSGGVYESFLVMPVID